MLLFFSALRIFAFDGDSDDTDDSDDSGIFLFFRSEESDGELFGLCLNKQINIYINKYTYNYTIIST